MSNLISGLDMSANALAAHKLQMRLISENIANAQTTKGPNGKPYQRKDRKKPLVYTGCCV